MRCKLIILRKKSELIDRYKLGAARKKHHSELTSRNFEFAYYIIPLNCDILFNWFILWWKQASISVQCNTEKRIQKMNSEQFIDAPADGLKTRKKKKSPDKKNSRKTYYSGEVMVRDRH